MEKSNKWFIVSNKVLPQMSTMRIKSSWSGPVDSSCSSSALARMPSNGDQSSWLIEEMKSDFARSTATASSRATSVMIELPKAATYVSSSGCNPRLVSVVHPNNPENQRALCESQRGRNIIDRAPGNRRVIRSPSTHFPCLRLPELTDWPETRSGSLAKSFSSSPDEISPPSSKLNICPEGYLFSNFRSERSGNDKCLI